LIVGYSFLIGLSIPIQLLFLDVEEVWNLLLVFLFSVPVLTDQVVKH